MNPTWEMHAAGLEEETLQSNSFSPSYGGAAPVVSRGRRWPSRPDGGEFSYGYPRGPHPSRSGTPSPSGLGEGILCCAALLKGASSPTSKHISGADKGSWAQCAKTLGGLSSGRSGHLLPADG